jgi:hypothetical protein
VESGVLGQNSENPLLHSILHHSILLISSVAPIVPRFGRAHGGVEHGAFGHGANHGAAVIRRGTHVADRLGFSRRLAADFLG